MKKSPHMPPNVRTRTRSARFAEPVVAVRGIPKTVNVRIGTPPPLRKRITIAEERAKITGMCKSSTYTLTGIFANRRVIRESVAMIKSGAIGAGETTQVRIAPMPRRSLT
jgi:hypothetical protein